MRSFSHRREFKQVYGALPQGPLFIPHKPRIILEEFSWNLSVAAALTPDTPAEQGYSPTLCITCEGEGSSEGVGWMSLSNPRLIALGDALSLHINIVGVISNQRRERVKRLGRNYSRNTSIFSINKSHRDRGFERVNLGGYSGPYKGKARCCGHSPNCVFFFRELASSTKHIAQPPQVRTRLKLFHYRIK